MLALSFRANLRLAKARFKPDAPVPLGFCQHGHDNKGSRCRVDAMPPKAKPPPQPCVAAHERKLRLKQKTSFLCSPR